MSLFALLGLGIVAFASTNVDDIVVLLGFFADPSLQTRNVGIGQYVGISVLVIVSLAASLISCVLAPAAIGMLGLLPLLIGAAKLLALRQTSEDSGDDRPQALHDTMLGQIGSVAAVTIANGGDNIGTYVPLFAGQSPARVAIIILVFMVMTALWGALAYSLVNHTSMGRPIRRYARITTPFVLIGLGLFILSEAGSFDMLRRVLTH